MLVKISKDNSQYRKTINKKRISKTKRLPSLDDCFIFDILFYGKVLIGYSLGMSGKSGLST